VHGARHRLADRVEADARGVRALEPKVELVARMIRGLIAEIVS
jgi:hypothetical protein